MASFLMFTRGDIAQSIVTDKGGDYPTPGGIEMVNRSFVRYMERKSGRAYDLL